MIPDLDPERLRQIGVPEDDAVVAILQRFVDTLEGRVAEITATAAESPTALARQLHQLGGSAANCGFGALAECCRRGETDPAAFEASTLATLAERAATAWQCLMSDRPRPHP